MKRSEIVEEGYDLAKEMVGTGNTPLEIHMRGIIEEFTRRLATKLVVKALGEKFGDEDLEG